MRISILVMVFILNGCVSQKYAAVTNSEVDSSVETLTTEAGLMLVDQISEMKLDDAVAHIEKKYSILEYDITRENELVFELNHLMSTHQDLSRNIDLLVRDNSENPFSYLIRGQHLAAKAKKARGDKWIHLTSDEQIQNMLSIQSRAIEDLQRVLETMPENYLAHIALGNIYKTRSEAEALSKIHFDRALQFKPSSYWVWEQLLDKLSPRWGGSYAAMEEAIESMVSYIPKNSNLAVLQNSILEDKGDLAELNRDFSTARRYYYRALDFGDDPRVLIGLGYMNLVEGNFVQGCIQVRLAAKLRPYARRQSFNLLDCKRRGM